MSLVVFNCHNCGLTLRATPAQEGSDITCKCMTTCRVPGKKPIDEFECGECGLLLRTTQSQRGTYTTCKCGAQCLVPGAKVIPPPKTATTAKGNKKQVIDNSTRNLALFAVILVYMVFVGPCMLSLFFGSSSEERRGNQKIASESKSVYRAEMPSAAQKRFVNEILLDSGYRVSKIRVMKSQHHLRAWFVAARVHTVSNSYIEIYPVWSVNGDNKYERKTVSLVFCANNDAKLCSDFPHINNTKAGNGGSYPEVRKLIDELRNR